MYEYIEVCYRAQNIKFIDKFNIFVYKFASMLSLEIS